MKASAPRLLAFVHRSAKTFGGVWWWWWWQQLRITSGRLPRIWGSIHIALRNSDAPYLIYTLTITRFPTCLMSLSLPRPCRTSVSALRSPVSLGVRLEPREASYQLHGSWGGLCLERSRLRVPAALAPASLMSRARIHTAAPHNRSSTLGHPRVPEAERPDAFEGRCSTGPANNAHVRNADHPAQPHGFGTI